MLELDKDRFAQLLREAPEKDVLFPEPQYSPYIQSLIDRLKEEESLDLAAIDWSAFEMADVIRSTHGRKRSRMSFSSM